MGGRVTDDELPAVYAEIRRRLPTLPDAALTQFAQQLRHKLNVAIVRGHASNKLRAEDALALTTAEMKKRLDAPS